MKVIIILTTKRDSSLLDIDEVKPKRITVEDYEEHISFSPSQLTVLLKKS